MVNVFARGARVVSCEMTSLPTRPTPVMTESAVRGFDRAIDDLTLLTDDRYVDARHAVMKRGVKEQGQWIF